MDGVPRGPDPPAPRIARCVRASRADGRAYARAARNRNGRDLMAAGTCVVWGEVFAKDEGGIDIDMEHDWTALDSVLAGEVLLPESPAYGLAYRSLNARFDDIRPQAIARCAGGDDVAEAMRFARQNRMAVATRAGGHCFGGRSSTEGLLIDVTPMHGVELLGDAVTVGGGTRLGEIYDTLLDHDVVIPAGSCPTVGIAGLTLGGGFGLIGRKFGLTSDDLLRVEIVLADGRSVACDEHHETDLFWALRGAGPGNFGVVTSLTFRTVPPPKATNFQLSWPFSEAVDVIEAWQDWAPTAPDELNASLLVKSTADPGEPSTVDVFGIMLGSESDAKEMIDRVVSRVPSDPTVLITRHMSYRETTRYWGARAARERVDGEPSGQELRGCRFIKSEFFGRTLPRDTIESLLGNFRQDRVAGQTRELDFSPWGGAYNRVRADTTAFFHRDDLFILKHAGEVGPDAPDAEREATHSWTTRSWETVHHLATGRVFPNFPDPDLQDWPRAYYGENLDRLLRVKARHDPDDLFRFRQSLSAS
jgi:FAD/FMN-containing dehydrogenase